MIKRKKEKSDDNDELIDEEEDGASVKIIKKSRGTSYYVYLNETISSRIKDYIDLMHMLDVEAQKNDIVYVKLTNFGGATHSGLSLCHSFRRCKAYVKMVVDDRAHSMGAVIALTGDELVLSNSSFLHFHNYSGGDFGKGAELHSSIVNQNRHYKEVMEYFCSPFLSAKEIQSIACDKDVYSHWNDKSLKKRMKAHFGR